MKKRLKIYMPFALNELKRNLAYKGAFYLFIFISMFGSFIQYFLWMAIYGSSDSATLGGLSRDEMIIYIFMVYVTSSLVMITISDWVSDDVVKGTVAMNLIKPIDYRMSLIARAFGQVIYRFLSPGGIHLDRTRNLQSYGTSFTCNKYLQYNFVPDKLYHELFHMCII